MKVVITDGGRADAGFQGETGDCGVRAISIALGLPYADVYKSINFFCKNEKQSIRKRGNSSPRTGIHKDVMHKFLEYHGWKWVPTMGIGTGCKVHLREDELPLGRLIVNLSRHYAAVIDGVLHDSYDCSRGGTRCVYGYWVKNC